MARLLLRPGGRRPGRLADRRAIVGPDDGRRAPIRVVTHAWPRWRSRPTRLAAVGFVIGAIAVVAGGQDGMVSTTTPLTSWFGLLSPTGYRPGHPWVAGLLLFLAFGALSLLWVDVVRSQVTEPMSERSMWLVAAGWGLPFVLGPPLISKDMFTYAAQGFMARHGLNPYASGVSALGRVHTRDAARLLAAVDPTWRSTPSPYGPVATTVSHLAASVTGEHAVATVVFLRMIAVCSVVAIGILAVKLAGDRGPARALSLTVMNPLVLIHLVSGGHWEAPMCALLLAALLAVRRSSWTLAVALACAAGSIKAPAFAAVPVIVAVHCFDAAPASQRTRVVRFLRDVIVAAMCTGGLSLLVRDGFGWIHNLNTPALGHTPIAPATLLADLLRVAVPSASDDNAMTAARGVCLLAAACILAYLVVTARWRSVEATLGCALLAVAVFSPTVFPWYLLWGLLCMAPTATDRQRAWIVAASASLSVAAITGAPAVVTSTFDAVAAAGAVTYLWSSRESFRRNRLNEL